MNNTMFDPAFNARNLRQVQDIRGNNAAPANAADADAFTKLATLWQPAATGAKGVDLLTQMQSNGSANSDGTIKLDRGQIVTSNQTFNSPVSFRAIINCNGGDTRLKIGRAHV